MYKLSPESVERQRYSLWIRWNPFLHHIIIQPWKGASHLREYVLEKEREHLIVEGQVGATKAQLIGHGKKEALDNCKKGETCILKATLEIYSSIFSGIRVNICESNNIISSFKALPGVLSSLNKTKYNYRESST